MNSLNHTGKRKNKGNINIRYKQKNKRVQKSNQVWENFFFFTNMIFLYKSKGCHILSAPFNVDIKFWQTALFWYLKGNVIFWKCKNIAQQTCHLIVLQQSPIFLSLNFWQFFWTSENNGNQRALPCKLNCGISCTWEQVSEFYPK